MYSYVYERKVGRKEWIQWENKREGKGEKEKKGGGGGDKGICGGQSEREREGAGKERSARRGREESKRGCTLMRSLARARTSEDISIVGELENLCFMYSNTPAHHISNMSHDHK